MGDFHTQPMKSHSTFNLLMDSLLTIDPPKSIKEPSPPLLPWTGVCFTIRPYVPSCNSLLFLNKPISLEKYLAIFKGQHPMK